MKIEGSTLPFRFSRDKLVEALEGLPIKVDGTKDLVLEAHMGLGKIVKVVPLSGQVYSYNLRNIRNTTVHVEDRNTYVQFEFHGVKYEFGGVSYTRLVKDKTKKKK